MPKFSTVNLWIEAESVLVPDIRRLHISDARQRLERARLRPGRVNERMTGGAEPNTILDQHPSPGTRLRPGSEVVMTMEVESAIVPSVERRHLNDAMRLIQAARLNFRKVREDITGTVPQGTVLHQTPSAGTRVRLHTMVDVVIEAESVIVPNVMGKNVNEAMQFVQRANLRPYTQMEYSGRATRNNVLRQNPGAGTRVRPGTAVTLSVEGAYLMMPNFIGLRIGQAQRLLMERGIGQVRTEQRETRSYSAGTVMDQYPRAGTPVRSLGEIRLVVAKEQLCVVPYLIGQTVSNAVNILRNAGLVPHFNCQGGDAGGCDYIRHRLTVRDQHPQGGTRLRCGSRVTLTYQGAVG